MWEKILSHSCALPIQRLTVTPMTPEALKLIQQAGDDVLANLEAIHGEKYAKAISAAAMAHHVADCDSIDPAARLHLLPGVARIIATLGKLVDAKPEQFCVDLHAFMGAIQTGFDHAEANHGKPPTDGNGNAPH